LLNLNLNLNLFLMGGMRMDWYHLRLGADRVAAGELVSHKEAFEAAFTAAGGPRAMALFQRGGADGGADLFFTPECGSYAALLLERSGAAPCERPSLVGLQLLVGHNEITYYMPP